MRKIIRKEDDVSGKSAENGEKKKGKKKEVGLDPTVPEFVPSPYVLKTLEEPVSMLNPFSVLTLGQHQAFQEAEKNLREVALGFSSIEKKLKDWEEVLFSWKKKIIDNEEKLDEIAESWIPETLKGMLGPLKKGIAAERKCAEKYLETRSLLPDWAGRVDDHVNKINGHVRAVEKIQQDIDRVDQVLLEVHTLKAPAQREYQKLEDELIKITEEPELPRVAKALVASRSHSTPCDTSTVEPELPWVAKALVASRSHSTPCDTSTIFFNHRSVSAYFKADIFPHHY